MKEVRDATAKILDNTSLADVQDRIAEVAEADALTFDI